MKIAVLHPSTVGSSSPFRDLDPDRNPAPYLPQHACETFSIVKATAVAQVIQVARRPFDVVVNLCDGAWDEDRPGIEVVQALERLEVAFTGAGSAFYEPTREAMKMAWHSAGLGVPAYALARGAGEAAAAAGHLRFPLIVKHPSSYSSVGMSRASKVMETGALEREVARMVEAYGAALIEEFIEGREFTILVAEPRAGEERPWVFRPVEYRFPPGESFKHFDLKWRDFGSMEARPVTDPELDSRLRDAAGTAFSTLNGSGYARCDLRMDASGSIYLLEINPNCGVFYPAGQYGGADVILAHDPAGHRGFLDHLLDCAVRRRERARRCWRLHFDRDSGFGMRAARAVLAGELVETYEERPHVLVSRRRVERAWDPLRRRWFDQYGWPLTDDVYVIWSDDPANWRPINHSCDPNTWLDGLDLVARRHIALGEALTIDYATFCGPGMEPFPCRCGAADCRGVIRGDDHRLAALRTRYGEHVSDYVKRAANASDD